MTAKAANAVSPLPSREESKMSNLVERRKKSGMSQFLCAQRSGISRMRLSLAETGQVALSAEEEASVRQVISDYIALKSREIALLMQDQQHAVAM
jgi:transcriptional regulator with XRE-family HTH domain